MWKETVHGWSVCEDGRLRNKKERDIGVINPKSGYRTVGYTNKQYYIHRLVAEAFIPNPDNLLYVDHINTIRNDNRVENLRWVQHFENHQNRSKTVKNTSGVKGVSWSKDRQKFEAMVGYKGKCVHVGRFDTLEEATVARLAKVKELYTHIHSSEI